jgi:hypothetical protein
LRAGAKSDTGRPSVQRREKRFEVGGGIGLHRLGNRTAAFEHLFAIPYDSASFMASTAINASSR